MPILRKIILILETNIGKVVKILWIIFVTKYYLITLYQLITKLITKANRNSDGPPVKKTPPQMEEFIGYVSEIEFIKNEKKMPDPVLPDLLPIYDLRDARIVRDVFAPHMNALEIFLRNISEEFAFTILKISVYFEQKGDDYLRSVLRDASLPIFKSILETHGTPTFLDCLRCYYGFERLHGLIFTITFNWKHKKDEILVALKDKNNLNEKFYLGQYFFGWNDYLALQATPKKDKDGKIKLYSEIELNKWIEILSDIELDRIRRCESCQHFFCASSNNRLGCLKCFPIGGNPRKYNWLCKF